MNEPSKFYTQHHAVEAPVIDGREFRSWWTVRKTLRLDELLKDQAITFAMWRAGVSFRLLAEIVAASELPAHWLDSPGGGGTMDRIVISVDADKKLNNIRREVGRFWFRLLELHLVDDLTWAELGRRLNVHRKTARNWTIAALALLAEVIWSGGRDVREKL